MKAITFVVDSVPPYKQTPADRAERERQDTYRRALQEKAREAFANSLPFPAQCAVTIRYLRSRGQADSANIIGGILDSLQGIAFNDDRQVTEITYVEWKGNRDWYQVIVAELKDSEK